MYIYFFPCMGAQSEELNASNLRINPAAQRNHQVASEYKRYTIADRMKVVATLIANPRRMEEVKVGFISDAGEVFENPNSHSDAIERIEKGELALAAEYDGRFVVIDSAKILAACANNDGDNCARDALDVVNRGANADPADRIVILSTHGVVRKDKRSTPVISWAPTPPNQ